MTPRPWFAVLALALALSGFGRADVELIGSFAIPGTAIDKSGLTNVLEEGTRNDRLGGLGSGIAYTGDGDRYILLSDRGPADGAASYDCRMHVYELPVRPGSPSPVGAEPIETVIFRDAKGNTFPGTLAAFDPNGPGGGRRLDPEGIRVSRQGTVFVSDEYGPHIYEFDSAGKFLRALPVPDQFKIAHPANSKEGEEPPNNTAGRYPNKGLEGLAITPDGNSLVAILQAPLIQDRVGKDGKPAKKGVNVRLLVIDLPSSRTSEFVYPMEDNDYGINEIVAINSREFLVLERDSESGAKSKFKKLMRIDLAGATDVSGVEALPAKGLPADIRPVKKAEFMDLLDPKYGIAGPSLQEKFEGLAFGPDLPDGRRLLLVTVDNDFRADQPTVIYAFAVDRADLPTYQPQRFAPRTGAPLSAAPPALTAPAVPQPASAPANDPAPAPTVSFSSPLTTEATAPAPPAVMIPTESAPVVVTYPTIVCPAPTVTFRPATVVTYPARPRRGLFRR